MQTEKNYLYIWNDIEMMLIPLINGYSSLYMLSNFIAIEYQ